MNTTKIYVIQQPGAIKRLMNTITFGSRFKGVSEKLDLNDLSVQLNIARDQVDGWRKNGPWPDAKFFIEQNDQEVVA